MKQEKQKISYDKESKVLSIEIKKGKSVDSDMQGNVVIDYDKKGDVVKVDLYGFSFEKFKDNLKPLREFSSKSQVPVLVK